jgi:hypothetical protein
MSAADTTTQGQTGPTPATAALSRIVLTLARSKEWPEGSAKHGYELVAPLGPDHRLDLAAWRERRADCSVRRFWAGEPDERGHLLHRPGGQGGATWVFDYDGSSAEDDEAGYRLGDHVFAPGEYVSVRDEEGVLHTFKVVAVTPA